MSLSSLKFRIVFFFQIKKGELAYFFRRTDWRIRSLEDALACAQMISAVVFAVAVSTMMIRDELLPAVHQCQQYGETAVFVVVFLGTVGVIFYGLFLGLMVLII